MQEFKIQVFASIRIFLNFLQNDVVIKMLIYDTMVEVYREYPSESYYTRIRIRCREGKLPKVTHAHI